MHAYGFGFLGAWHLLTTLVFLGGLALLIVWLFRGGAARTWLAGPPGPRVDPALDVLRRRFAAGEIDANEFESRRRLLEGDTAP